MALATHARAVLYMVDGAVGSVGVGTVFALSHWRLNRAFD